MLSAAICLALAPTEASDDGIVLPPLALPTLPSRAAGAEGFVPPGWRLETKAGGDLNRDGRADLVLVLRGEDPACHIVTELSDKPIDTNPRLLVVAFGRAGGFHLQLANASVIPRREDPYVDDPLENGGLEVRKDVIRVTLGYWRSMGGWGTFTNRLSFRWNGRAFALIGFDRDHLQRNSGATEQLSVNYLTGKARVTYGSMDDAVAERAEWKPLRTRAAPTLDTIGNGLEFEPDIPGLD